MANSDFLHLPIPRVLEGAARLRGFGQPSVEEAQNRAHFRKHGQYVAGAFNKARKAYKAVIDSREEANLPSLPANTPFLLRLDEGESPEFLLSLGIEVVAETPDGIILVAADDISAETFEDKISRFIEQRHGGGSVAKILDLASIEKVDQRLVRILSPELYNKFHDIDGAQQLVVDVGIECQGTQRLPDYPTTSRDETDEHYESRVLRWRRRYDAALEEIDNLQIAREQEFFDFVAAYGGEALEITQEQLEHVLPDSFTVRVKLSGAALGDVARNYPFVFDIQEADVVPPDIAAETGWAYELDFDIQPPSDSAGCLAIVDSGLQENHPMLHSAVDVESVCLIPGSETDTADYVSPSGHGTRVAGAALYRTDPFPASGEQFSPPIWIKNVRVLDQNNLLPNELFPPRLMEDAAEACLGGQRRASTINLSVTGRYPCRTSYMSAWASAIDKISNERDLLFVSCAGNLPDDSRSSRLGIVSSIAAGYAYPDFLLQPGCRISNPAQSLQALTVGAVNIKDFADEDFQTVSGKDMPSSYSASGYGIWGSVKPEVVVPVGDLVFSKAEPIGVRVEGTTASRLVRSTLHGGPLLESDGIGTSYAAPVAASLAAELSEVYPSLTSLARKAVLVSSARWPAWVNGGNRELALRTIGYGVVDAEKVLENDNHRVCLVSEGGLSIKQKQTHLYKIPIPADLRSPEVDSQVRVSVTLCYSAKPRRTRSTVKRYYSSWLDWRTSRRSESFQSFARVACRDADQDVEPTDDGAFPWVIGSAANYGVAGFTRSNSACQKDWFDLPSYELPAEFGIAVTSHQGWDPDLESECKYALVIALESLDQDMPIYAPISVVVEELRQEVAAEIEV